MKKRLLNAILIIGLLVVILPTVVFAFAAGGDEISTVAFTMEEPKVGAVITTAETTTPGLRVDRVTWYTAMYGGEIVTTIEDNRYYAGSIAAQLSPDYTFSENLTATINGQAIALILHSENGWVYFYFDYNKGFDVGGGEISTVAFTMEEPKVGAVITTAETTTPGLRVDRKSVV